MKKRRLMTWFGLLLLAVVLLVGFLEVLNKRFAEGGIYPHYASYRTDPLGTSALYETLAGLEGREVSRNITFLNSISGLDGDTVLLLLGYPRESLDDLRATPESPVLAAVRKGARLVITINPGLVPEKYQPAKSEEEKDWFEKRKELREERIRSEKGEEAKDESTSEEGIEDGEDSGDEEFEEAMAGVIGKRLSDILGFELASLEAFDRPEGGWDLSPGDPAQVTALPGWYSQFRFTVDPAAWDVIATADEKPVVIERRLGKGSVVLASDSFFVSNEALHLEPVPEFLVWILGGKPKVVFDETIHGSQETGGAMKLMRRYRIHGIFFGILVFVALWAWRSSSPLAPGDDELDRGLVGSGSAVSGEQTSNGLVRILRHSIEPGQLIAQCLELWKESRSRPVPVKLEKELDAMVKAHETDPKGWNAVATYRRLVDSLRRN